MRLVIDDILLNGQSITVSGEGLYINGTGASSGSISGISAQVSSISGSVSGLKTWTGTGGGLGEAVSGFTSGSISGINTKIIAISGQVTGLTGESNILRVDPIYGNDDNPQNYKYSTITGAIADAVSGTLISLGAGFFNMGTGQVLLPAGASLVGEGMLNTVIRGSRSGIYGSILNPGSSSSVSDLTIKSTGAGFVQFPLGVSSGSAPGQSFINASFRNVKTEGDSNGLHIGSGKLCSFNAYNCNFESNYDAASLYIGTGNFYNCIISSIGGSVINPSYTYGLSTNGSGVCNVFGGKISSSNAFLSYGASVFDKGSLILDGASISTQRTGYDIYNGLTNALTGYVSVSNVSYDKGKIRVGDYGSTGRIVDKTPPLFFSGTSPSSGNLSISGLSSGSLPVYGGTGRLLGDPSGWMTMDLSGFAIQIPFWR